MNNLTELGNLLAQMNKRLERLENNTSIGKLFFRNGSGRLKVPVYTGDPTSPENGEIWYNSSTNAFRVRRNGTNQTITSS